ncbi:MAG: DUF86 domain-containing protein [Phycisphaerales bacterium]
MWRDDAYILDMLLAARKVLEFTKGVDWHRFEHDDLVQNAVMRHFQIIGEAASRVSPGYKGDHPEIPWKEIVDMRNRLVHEYFRILPDRVWDVVERHVPVLVRMLEPLVPPDDTGKSDSAL